MYNIKIQGIKKKNEQIIKQILNDPYIRWKYNKEQMYSKKQS